MAWNKYFGWYYDTVADFGPFMDDYHARFPDDKIGISE
jgi:beta-galactosidase